MKHEFEAEYTTTVDGYTISVEKIGGGTVGKAYAGTWAYAVTDSTGAEIVAGTNLYTGMPKTHAEAALIVIDFTSLDSEADSE